MAGEPSGDLHGGRVVTALRRRFPEAHIDAVGGPHIAAAGATIRQSIDALSAIGLVEILGRIPAHWRLGRELMADFRAHRYDLVIPIDYPGFHGRLARAAKRAGIPVLWYIAPQHWGWLPRRARGFARIVDRVAVILPFEAEFFARAGVAATFVGHPLLDSEPAPGRAAARHAMGLAGDARVLALFPGSRPGEIHRLWPVMRDTALLLLRNGACTDVLVAATRLGHYPDPGPLRLVDRGSPDILAASDAAIVKSGTTTLQAALAGVPMVVAYSLNRMSAVLLRRLLTTRWVALPNLIANREVVPELLQDQLSVVNLLAAVTPLLDVGSDVAARQRAGLAEVRKRLGGPGASARVAELAGELLAA